MKLDFSQRNYLVVLVTSVLGAGFLLLGDFAVWQERELWYRDSSGNPHYYWSDHYVWSFENLLTAVIFLEVALLLLGAAWVAFQGLRVTDAGAAPLSDALQRRGFLFAQVACIEIFAGGMIFLITMAIEEPSDWWLDVGFYGSLVFSLSAVFFFWRERRARAKSAESPT